MNLNTIEEVGMYKLAALKETKIIKVATLYRLTVSNLKRWKRPHIEKGLHLRAHL